MAVAQGTCPSCGAPIEFGVGSSVAKVCEYCRATVLRTDRGLQNLGKVADIVDTPSLIAVGDQGTLGGRPFEVMGRVQLDHGAGPWDEYYVAFDYGQAWGWLAYAQGNWYVTSLAPGLGIPAYSSLALEMDVPLGQVVFRVAEIKTGTVRSTEGELPLPYPAGFVRYYADCTGPNNAFATLDYGDGSGAASVFLGWIFAEPQLQVTALGPRTQKKVKTDHIKCPNCGGDIPKLSGERAERVGCPFCGAVSDIAAQQVVFQQEAARRMPDIPLGARGTFENQEYVCIAYVRRGSDFDGDHFSWEEYLLWGPSVGFRWLVKDPETGWTWVTPVNASDLDLRGAPDQVAWNGRVFSVRNQNSASVEYVLGEVYWKCQVGETTQVSDFTNGRDVLSREEAPGEVHWSFSTPIPWPVIAQAFGVPIGGAGGHVTGTSQGGSGGVKPAVILLIVLLIILLLCMMGACGTCGSGGGTSLGGSRGGGVFYGGK